MKPTVIVDTRETRSKVPKILEKFTITRYEPLSYGDYQISDDIIFERKTFSDWEGSVIDGRIFRQAEGLRREFKTPIFILEGGPNYGARGHARPKLNKASLHGSYLSITSGFGIPIIPTNNPTESANLILQAAKREQEGKPARPINVQTHKKGSTKSEIRQQVFSCFPGIGPKLAKELDSIPYSLLQILKAIDRCQIKKLGPKKIQGIQEVLNYVDV